MAGEIQITGIDDLRRALERAGRRAVQALTAAMVDEMDSVMEDAKRLTPVDTGTLRASGVVLPPETQGGQITVTAGFGGAASAYAVVQHERLDYNHTVGQAKFLEQPMNERRSKIAANLAARVQRALS